MASKKYKLKTCAYCGKEKASEVQEHVIAREFVLERFRDGMPAVPACKRCNTKKSALETYAMAVLPFGSVLPDSEEYIAAKLEAGWPRTRSCGGNWRRAGPCSGCARTAF